LVKSADLIDQLLTTAPQDVWAYVAVQTLVPVKRTLVLSRQQSCDCVVLKKPYGEAYTPVMAGIN